MSASDGMGSDDVAAPPPADVDLLDGRAYQAFWEGLRAWDALWQPDRRLRRPDAYALVRPPALGDDVPRGLTLAEHLREARRLERDRRDAGEEDD